MYLLAVNRRVWLDQLHGTISVSAIAGGARILLPWRTTNPYNSQRLPITMNETSLRYLPADVDPATVRTTLGIVSDTHMGQRMSALPQELFDILAGVDLLLHGGDVGALSVLDELSAIAPVIAVQGNDDSTYAKQHLPLQQVVAVGGQRVLLWHSHFVDPLLERESRLGDELPPKLERTVAQARACGASLAVFGHWHIPLVWDAGDVLVVNPGAMASANDVTRQHQRTVAKAWLLTDGSWRVVHIAIEAPDQPFDPDIDWSAGFASTWARFSSTILAPELRAQMPLLRQALSEETIAKLRMATSAAAQRVWAGEAPLLTWRDIEREVFASQLFTPEEESALRALRAEMIAKETIT